MLLIGRAFQGLGCAGIEVLVQVTVADKVSLEENAKTWSIFSLIGGVLGWGLGPVLGGEVARLGEKIEPESG
jgi:MFS family permease